MSCSRFENERMFLTVNASLASQVVVLMNCHCLSLTDWILYVAAGDRVKITSLLIESGLAE